MTARRRSPQLTYATRLEDAYESADLAMVLTEWSEFLALDPAAVGWIYPGLGRP